MPALVAGTHVFSAAKNRGVDGRDKPGHDEQPFGPGSFSIFGHSLSPSLALPLYAKSISPLGLTDNGPGAPKSYNKQQPEQNRAGRMEPRV